MQDFPTIEETRWAGFMICYSREFLLLGEEKSLQVCISWSIERIGPFRKQHREQVGRSSGARWRWHGTRTKSLREIRCKLHTYNMLAAELLEVLLGRVKCN